MAGNYWTPIFEFLSEDATIATWLTDEQRRVLEGQQLEELPIWRALLLYQGFDLKRIIRNMIARRREYQDRVAFEEVRQNLRVGDREVEFVYNNQESMAKDLELIIFLFAERGNTVDKITEKSIPVVATIIGWLTEKYELDTTNHAPGTALLPDVVTISRIVSCFPVKICEYYHRGFGNALYSHRDIGIQVDPHPTRSLLCPHLIAMVPRRFCEMCPNIHLLFFLCHVLVDGVIHRKLRNYTPLQTMFTYYAAEYRTELTSQVSRLNFMRSVALAAGDAGAPVPFLIEAANRSIGILQNMVGGDPNFDNVIQDLQNLR